VPIYSVPDVGLAFENRNASSSGATVDGAEADDTRLGECCVMKPRGRCTLRRVLFGRAGTEPRFRGTAKRCYE